MTTAPGRETRADLVTAAWIAFTALAFYALVNCGYIDNVDSETQQLTARNVLAGHGFGLDSVTPRIARFTKTGVDGREYMHFGPGTVLLHIPALVAAQVIGATGSIPEAKLASFLMSFTGPLFAALGAGTLYLLARRLAFTPRAALLAAVVHGAATHSVVYARSTYYETPIAALLVLTAYLALDPRLRAWTAVVGGVALSFALTLKLAWLIAVPPLALLVLAPGGGRALRRGAWLLTPVALTLAAYAAFNDARFGSPFATGYRDSELATPLVDGLRQLTLSSHGSLLLYAPILALSAPGLWPLWRRSRITACSVALLTSLAFGLHAHALDPPGGSVYGPRYLVPLTPFLALPAAAFVARTRGVRRGLAILLVVVSALIHVPALCVSFRDYWAIRRELTAAQVERLPAPLVVYAHVARAALTAPEQPLDLATVGAQGAGEADPEPPGLRSASTGLDWWWLRAGQRYHPAIGWATPLGLIALGLAGGFVVRRRVEPASASPAPSAP